MGGALSLVLALAFVVAMPSSAPKASAAPLDDAERVSSPDGSLDVSLGVVDGRLTYAVDRDATTSVVAPSGLGLKLSEPSVDLTTGMEILSVERDTADETWTPAWGTQSSVRNHYNELVLRTRHTESGTLLDLTVRVFDDGFGLRYTFPRQESLGEFNVTEESTEFGLPSDLTAYYLRSGTDWNADERHYITAPVTSVETAQTPITLSREDGLFLSVHEAQLVDYPSMMLRRGGPGLRSDLTALPGGLKAVLDVSDEAFSTPWRTITVGRDAGDLAESQMIANLNPPCEICDVDSDGDGTDDTADWIEPATYTGVWWELQRRATTWTDGDNLGATTERTKEYIDLAAEAGAKYVLAEGWNTGAGGSWTGQDFTTPRSKFDVEEVIRYGRTKGVGWIAHNETRGFVDYYDENLERIFKQYYDWGVHAIKSGYATKFELGGRNRSHADQEAVRHYQRVIDTAAKYEININAHEAIKPTGLHRTYPNMMTSEGVAGMEQHNHKGANGNPPEQATILPFTRWIGGPADYTPGVLNVTWDPARLNTRVQSTTTNQLALFTTFWSPLQMLADTPENYEEFSSEFEYLKDMPATWDESHVLDAQIGDHVVTARRSGDRWYVGAVTDENDRTVPISLDFLSADTRYLADVYADGEDASWKGNPTSVERTRGIVDASTTLDASMVGAGGFAVKLTEATPEQVEELPELGRGDIAPEGTPTVTYDPYGGEVVVEVEVRNTGSQVASTHLFLDGSRVDAPGVRLAGGERATMRARVPVGSFAYTRSNELALGDGQGLPGESVEVAMLPFPETAMIDRVEEVGADGALSAQSVRRITGQLQEAITRAGAGDLAGVELAMQSIRLHVLSASPSEVDADAARELIRLTGRWLGDPYGLMGLLADIRTAQDESTIEEADARTWREHATAAVRAAIREDDERRDEALQSLTTALETAEGAPSEALLATALQQLADPELLEAEDGRLTGGTRVNAEHPGYTGSGFVRSFDTVGACAAVPTDGVAPGAYLTTVRFANGMTVEPLERQLTLTVGERTRRVTFSNQTGADRWRQYVSTSPYAFQVDGEPLELCYRNGDSGNVNVDSLTLTPDPGVIPDSADVGVPSISTATDPATPDGANGWWTSPVRVSAEAGDVEGAEAELRLDAGPWRSADEPLVLQEDGRHVVGARAVAGDQVSPTTELEIPIDATAPTSSASLEDRTVTVEASDATSGVERIEVRWSGEEEFSVYDDPIEAPADGGVLQHRAVDVAGNVGEVGEVRVATATTTEASAPDRVEEGDVVPVQVLVSGPEGAAEARAAAAGDPTGTVTVTADGRTVAEGELVDGRVTIEVSDLDAGERALRVRYAGDGDFAPSEDTVTTTVVASAGGSDPDPGTADPGPGSPGDGSDDGSASGGSPGDAAGGGLLPSTGGPAAWLLALGALLAAAGAVLWHRRRPQVE